MPIGKSSAEIGLPLWSRTQASVGCIHGTNLAHQVRAHREGPPGPGVSHMKLLGLDPHHQAVVPTRRRDRHRFSALRAQLAKGLPVPRVRHFLPAPNGPARRLRKSGRRDQGAQRYVGEPR